VVTEERGKKSGSIIPEDRPKRITDAMSRTPKSIRAYAAFEYATAHNNSISARTSLTDEYKDLFDLIKKGPKANEKLIKTKEALGKLKPGTKAYTKKLETLKEYKKLVEDINEANVKIKNINKYRQRELNVRHRTKKSIYSHIWIEKNNMTRDGKFNFFSSYKLGEINRAEEFEVTSDFIVRRNNRLDIWEVIISEEVKIEDVVEHGNFIAFDPGVRTFLTGIDSDGKIIEYNNSRNKIEDKFNIIDQVQSIIGHKVTGKQRLTRKEKKLRKRKLLAERKIVSIIDNSHKHIASDVVKNYDLIILPKLKTKQLVQKDDVSSNVKRRISAVAHCRFHDYISYKAKLYGKTLVDLEESYTTKTCYNCGMLNDIGSKKVYECCSCNRKTDRDIQASLNILTKFIGKLQVYVGKIEKGE